MAGETYITLVGNLTRDPEVRFTAAGAAVANFTVASSPRVYDRQSGEWKDGDTTFMNCSAWRQMAENVAESLQKGMRVIVYGRLKTNSWETQEGEKRSSLEVEVEEIGPALRNATAKVTRTTSGAPSSGGGNWGGNAGGGWSPAAPSGDNRAQVNPWDQAQSDEPPF